MLPFPASRITALTTSALTLLTCLACCGIAYARYQQGASGASETAAQPALFAEGVISTPDRESNAAFAPDGKTVYFTKLSYDQAFTVILLSRLRDGRWTKPEVAQFSGRHNDGNASISPDGSKLVFSSNRPVNGKAKRDYDLWIVERSGDGWGAPAHLGSEINTDSTELSPSIASDGTLYFWSDRAGGKGGVDLYRSRPTGGRYAEAENLGDAINSESNELDLFVAPDESYIVFTSDRSGGQGRTDLYVSHNREGVWSAPKNLGAWVNSASAETAPHVSPDGKHLLFTSARGRGDAPFDRPVTYRELKGMVESALNGLGNIYLIDARVLRN